ncbi:hypothetical protein CROQUDRAFT_656467 [Cronartium quercuum f. sp. fusiforme G11]|uniref:F-box domain-containing protein n=1 Tax=Cronartium quercuum f. sp. fusiforme G11 TaxID=708437 RepID=A0A9P6NKB6_9BASI|nr:hypothetical protein CROQUDRAFT_656467 [Cronartium quercuum f. sp. fusiforme G11]
MPINFLNNLNFNATLNSSSNITFPQDRLRSRSGKARRKQARRSTPQSSPATSFGSPSSPQTSIEDDHWLAFKTHQAQFVKLKEVRSSSPPYFLSDQKQEQYRTIIASSSATCAFERLPNEILERIFEFVPDKYSFPPTFRSRHSLYGFSPPFEHDPLACLSAHHWNESEGWAWYTPPMHYRLVNKRWAVVAAQVFLRHLSITTFNRLEALGKLVESSPLITTSIRTLAISCSSETESPDLLRASFKRLLSPLTSLRSLSLRTLSPGLLFPAPLTVSSLFLPPSILRFSIEFSPSTSSLVTALGPSPPISVTLHAAELNLFLVSLPNLKSLHLSKFISKQTRPLNRYFSKPIKLLNQNKLIFLSLNECELNETDSIFLGSHFGFGIKTLIINQTYNFNNLNKSITKNYQNNLKSLMKFCDYKLECLKINLTNYLELKEKEEEMTLDSIFPKLINLKCLMISGGKGLINPNSLIKLPNSLKKLHLEHIQFMLIDIKSLKKLCLNNNNLIEIIISGQLGYFLKSVDFWDFQSICWSNGIKWSDGNNNNTW